VLPTLPLLANPLSHYSCLPLSSVPAGPYELLFALFACYYALVPRLHPSYFSVGRLKFSDKSLWYLLGLQLLLNSGARSALLGLSGLLFGALYLSDAVGMATRCVCPRPLRSCGSRYVLPWWEAESPADAAARGEAARQQREEAERQREQLEAQMIWQQVNGGGGGRGAAGGPAAAARLAAAGGRGRGRGAGGGGGTGAQQQLDPAALAAMLQAMGQPGAAPGGGGAGAGAAGVAPGSGPAASRGTAAGGAEALPMPAADPAALERLVGMGFERSAAEAALRRAYNDETAAANRLLEG